MNLHFGADMWRVYGTYWVWFLYFIVTWIVFWIVLFAAGAIGAMIGGRDNPMIAGLLVMGVCAVWVLAWIYVTVRLAPAAASHPASCVRTDATCVLFDRQSSRGRSEMGTPMKSCTRRFLADTAETAAARCHARWRAGFRSRRNHGRP